jgi:adenine/guanine phosphoribosyltransferase-like PRPP-binding protein
LPAHADPPTPSPRAGDAASYPQPTPRRLYVHDDLTDEVARRLGPDSAAADLVRALLEVIARDRERVRIVTLAEQLDRIVAQGPHAPFELTVGIGRAGEHVARALDARTGWFPRIRRVGLTREEDGRGGYLLVSTDEMGLAAQLAAISECRSLAVVDDTVFSGLTLRGVLEALPAPLRARARAFCARGVAQSIDALAALCPITAGIAAPGRKLDDVSFINASGLVRRVAIRRRGRPALAFFERPEWISAWFPKVDGEVLQLCRRLNAILEPA